MSWCPPVPWSSSTHPPLQAAWCCYSSETPAQLQLGCPEDRPLAVREGGREIHVHVHVHVAIYLYTCTCTCICVYTCNVIHAHYTMYMYTVYVHVHVYTMYSTSHKKVKVPGDWFARGSLPVRSRFGRGSVGVRSRFGR